MIFVGKNKRIVLKMLTANSKNTNTMLAISSRNIYDLVVAYYGILMCSLDLCQLCCGISVVDMWPFPGACGKGWEATWGQITEGQQQWHVDHVWHGQEIIGCQKSTWLKEGALGSFPILGWKFENANVCSIHQHTWFLPYHHATWYPRIIWPPQQIPFITQKLRRTVKFGGRNVGAQGFLKKRSTNSFTTHSDFQGEMTQHQDFLAQWRHVDDQDQSTR